MARKKKEEVKPEEIKIEEAKIEEGKVEEVTRQEAKIEELKPEEPAVQEAPNTGTKKTPVKKATAKKAELKKAEQKKASPPKEKKTLFGKKKEVKEDIENEKVLLPEVVEDTTIVEDKMKDPVKIETIVPNITVEAPNPAVNNVKSEFMMPKKLKVSLSTPFMTFCVFLVTLAIVGVCAVTGYGIYHVINYGINFGDKVDLAEYQAMVAEYNKVIDSYDKKIERYELEIEKYEGIIDKYSAKLSDYDKKLDTQSLKLEEILDGYQSKKEDENSVISGTDETFVIYYQDSYADIIMALLDYCDIDRESVKLISFFNDNIDVDEMLENGDLIIYEAGSITFDEEDILSKGELGFAKKDLSKMFKITDKLGLNAEGDLKEFSYIICPGYIQVRADLAEKYLGTTDPDELYEQYFCDMETMANTSNMVYQSSKGKVALFASNDEINLMYENALEDADITFEEFVHMTDGSIYDAEMWDSNWYDYIQGNNKKKSAMAVVGTSWFTKYLLIDTKFYDGNTILVKAPVDYTWGGESIAVPAGSKDADMAKLLIQTMLDDEQFGLIINNDFDDAFINNSDVVEDKDFNYDIDDIIYDDQDYIEFIEELLK